MEDKKHGGAGRGQGRKSPYGVQGARQKSFKLPADPKKFDKAVEEINELLKKYHEKP